MSAIVTFNGDGNILQPSGLKEEIVRQVHDRVSVTGVQRRIWMADKHKATLTWDACDLASYNYLAQYLYNQATPITYANSVTGWSFTGFATAAEDDFLRGSTFIRKLSVTILEL